MVVELTVSTPSHPRYGQHLTNEEVDELVKPADNTLSLVHDWLFDSGIDRAQLSYNRAKDFIKVSLPVSDIERLLDTEYSIYEHLDGDRIIRAPKWSLPKHLHEHIDTIQPTNSFFRPAGRRRTLKTIKPFQEVEAAAPPDFTAETEVAATPDSENAAVAKVCNTTFVTPLCLRTFYGTKGYIPQVPGQNQVGLTDFLGEANNRSDVQIFLEMFRKAAVSEAETFTVDVINGGNNQQTPDNATELADGKDLEGNLDAETIIGIDYPTPLTAFTTGGMPPFDPDDLTRKPILFLQSLSLAVTDVVSSNQHQRALFAIPQRSPGYGYPSSNHQLFLWRRRANRSRSLRQKGLQSFRSVGSQGHVLSLRKWRQRRRSYWRLLHQRWQKYLDIPSLLPRRLPLRYQCWSHQELQP